MISRLMITDLLVDNSALVPVGLLLIGAACAGAGYLARRARRVLWALAVLSTLPVVALTLVPTSGRAYAVCAIQFSVPTLGAVESLTNVALLFPAVFFATLATRRPLRMLVAGASLSAAIEAIQAVVPAIGRACDTNDWLMNTAGALLAVLLGRATLAVADRTFTNKAATRHAETPPGDHPEQ